MNVPVVITGMGVVSPIGIGLERFWDALVLGTNGISTITAFDTTAYRTHKGGEIRDFEPASWTVKVPGKKTGRASQFALAASHMALEDGKLELARTNRNRIAVCVGTTMGEGQLIEEETRRVATANGSGASDVYQHLYPAECISALISREFSLGGPSLVFGTACAAGNYAIGHAADLLRSGKADVVLAGGSDPLSRVAFTGFNSMLAVAPERCQPFDRNRKGMCLSEGCGMLLLETLTHAANRNAKIYAEVLAYGISNDAYHITSPHTSARGAIAAMTAALSDGGLEASSIDYVSAHGTGTKANDKIETAAIKAVLGDRAYKTPVSSAKSMLGHMMGAASAVEAVVCALTISRNVIPPTINYCDSDPECDLDYVPNIAREARVRYALSNAFAFGGNNSSLLLGKHGVH